MEQGYYSPIETPREALYEAACAMDSQDVPAALERLAVVEEENRRLRAVIEEVHSWAVCACFATPEDMAQNFPRIVEITTPNA